MPFCKWHTSLFSKVYRLYIYIYIFAKHRFSIVFDVLPNNIFLSYLPFYQIPHFHHIFHMCQTPHFYCLYPIYQIPHFHCMYHVSNTTFVPNTIFLPNTVVVLNTTFVPNTAIYHLPFLANITDSVSLSSYPPRKIQQHLS